MITRKKDMPAVAGLILFILVLWSGLQALGGTSGGDKGESRILLRPQTPGQELKAETAALLNMHLRAAELADERNRRRLFQPVSLKTAQQLADSLALAAEQETDECYRHYLFALSASIRSLERFYPLLPQWRELSENSVEIIFPYDSRYNGMLWFVENGLGLSAGNMDTAGKTLFDTYVYVNRPEDTRFYEQYPRLFGKLTNHLPAEVRRKLPYTPFAPGIKMVDLVWPREPKTLALPFPDFQWAPGGNHSAERGEDFSIIIFKNLAEAYFEGVLKPLAGRTLSDAWLYEADSEAFISNMVMRRIAHHIGPVFRVALRDEPPPQTQLALPPGPDQFVSRQKIPKYSKSKKEDKELLTVNESMARFFPALAAVKAQALAQHGVKVLLENGLLGEERDGAVYAAHVLVMLDKIRNTGIVKKDLSHFDRSVQEELKALNASADAVAAVVQFNYLARAEAIPFDVASQKLNLDKDKFRAAYVELARDILRIMENPSENAAEFFMQRNMKLPQQVEEVLKNCLDLPVMAAFHLETGKTDHGDKTEKKGVR